MTNLDLGANSSLLIAGRGAGPSDGLHLWRQCGGRWSGNCLDTVEQLAALSRHPKLPIVYGVSGVRQEGMLHAWALSDEKAKRIGKRPTGGYSPCHLTIDPTNNWIIITNYRTSSLALQCIGPDGSFAGETRQFFLKGSGPDPDRQDAAHPHQAWFAGGRLIVLDLGADLIREFSFDPHTGTIHSLRDVPVPPRTGPRHGAMLPDGRLALCGELGSTMLLGSLTSHGENWAVCPSTHRTGPAITRSLRNYPGDLQCSPDGRFAYLANRGYDTISTFDVSGGKPVAISEIDAQVDWPQHFLILGDRLLVAGWDSSQVVAFTLIDGVPQNHEILFECPGAGWLLPY